MTQASDRIDDTCTTRAYTFDTVGRRTALTTTTQTCDDDTTTTSSSKTWDYDKADRLLSGANGTGTYTYDPLGRQLSLPAIDTPQGIDAGNLTIGYYDNDLARSVTQNGVTTTYDIDVMERRSTSTTTGGTSTSTTQRYYEDISDNPAWSSSTVGEETALTRYETTIGGDLSVTISDDGVVSLAISNPNGDVVTTVPLTGDQAGQGISGWAQFDEYGNQLTTPVNTGVTSYGWKGAAQRALDAESGLILMGARLYNSVTGSFTSVDPVAGGNTTAYAYPQDPINKEDLDGKVALWRRALGNGIVRGIATTFAVGAICAATAGWGCAVVAGTMIGGSLGGAGYWANNSKRTRSGWAKAVGGGALSGMFNGGLGYGAARHVYKQQVTRSYKSIKVTRKGTQLVGRHAAIKPRGYLSKGKYGLHQAKHWLHFRKR